MAFIRIFQPPGVTAEIYDRVNAQAGVEGDPPAGLLFHCAGALDGGWQILDVWESREDAQRFDTERLLPAIESVTGTRPPGPVSGQQEYELHTVIGP